MRAIDTNVLVRLITRDDPAQVEKAEAYVAPGAWLSHLVLAETLWVLESVYGLKARQLATVVSMLLEHDQLVLQEPDVVRNALEEFARRRSLGFSDCLIIEIARNAGHTPSVPSSGLWRVLRGQKGCRDLYPPSPGS